MNYFKQQSQRLFFKKLTPSHIPRWIDFFTNNDSLDFLGLDLTNGTEAAKQLLQFGSNNINTGRFISIIHVDNKASINVARKNGMTVLFETNYMDMPVKVFGIVVK